MNRGRMKAQVKALLSDQDPDAAVRTLCRWPRKKVLNVLFSFLYSGDEHLKWRAVTAMAAVVARLADEDMESARVIVRRLMWNLNDESGGIGWGSPEALGEILARHEGLAREYGAILVSYARQDGNFQEDERMQRGVLWGLGRLAQERPEWLQEVIPHLPLFLHSADPAVRAHAARLAGMLGPGPYIDALKRLTSDEAQVHVWIDKSLKSYRVKDLAMAALRQGESCSIKVSGFSVQESPTPDT